jgi:hypothetical protein
VRASDLPFFPDFFLAGAPRCGTTSISKVLARHPQICFSRPKEVNYFIDATPERLASLQVSYLDRYFPHHDASRHLAVGEGSVSYLYYPDALGLILELAPGARFLVALRNPIDMLRSYHLRMLYLLEEDEVDFERAWDLQETRLRGERIPRRCGDPRRLLYGEVGSLGKHVQKLLALAGKEQCFLVLSEDLKARPHEVYPEMLRFLGVSDRLDFLRKSDGEIRFPRRLRSRGYRWRWLQTLLYKPPQRLFGEAKRREIRRGVRPSALRELHRRLLRLNRRDVDPAPLSPGTRARLRQALDADIQTLEALLGRDLGHWQ